MLLRIFLFVLILPLFTCEAQTQKNSKQRIVGGPCQDCEALFDFGNRMLKSIDTLPGFQTSNPKLKLSGTVYQKDAKTPANGIIIYIYHTDRNGIYKPESNAKGWAKRHGYHRGWTKTDKDGNYTFYTFRPAAYPNHEEPEHIHITIKEPDSNPYYLDSVFFEDDPLLTADKKGKLKNRGGSGLVSPAESNGILMINRDIILGENIPDY